MPASYEFLRALFGTTEDGKPEALTFDQLAAKLDEGKVKIADLGTGAYVSKEKFDAKETELTGVRKQLEEANASIQSYKDMDIEGIKKAAADWEKKYTDDTAALNQKLKDQERAHNEDMFLSGFQFSSKAAAAGIKAEFVKRNFPFEDGTFIGGKEFMEKLMADDDYKAAFKTAEQPTPAPQPEPTPEKPKPQFSTPSTPEPAPKPKKSLAELMRMKNENPNAQISFD